jgi:hypothetical protein
MVNVGNQLLGGITGNGPAHNVGVVIRLLDYDREVNIIFSSYHGCLELCLCPCGGIIDGEWKGLHKSIHSSSITIEKPGNIMGI